MYADCNKAATANSLQAGPRGLKELTPVAPAVSRSPGESSLRTVETGCIEEPHVISDRKAGTMQKGQSNAANAARPDQVQRNCNWPKNKNEELNDGVHRGTRPYRPSASEVRSSELPPEEPILNAVTTARPKKRISIPPKLSRNASFIT